MNRKIFICLLTGYLMCVALSAEAQQPKKVFRIGYLSRYVPEPDIVKIPLSYAIARRDQNWGQFINTWIELKRRDGTIDALYGHWILGKQACKRQPRWSIMRNVLHWVE